MAKIKNSNLMAALAALSSAVDVSKLSPEHAAVMAAVAPKAVEGPRPKDVYLGERHPNPAKNQDWAPFRVLAVTNGKAPNEWGYRVTTIDRLTLNAALAFAGVNDPAVSAKLDAAYAGTIDPRFVMKPRGAK